MTVPEVARGTKPKPHRTQSSERPPAETASPASNVTPTKAAREASPGRGGREPRGRADTAAKASKVRARTGCRPRSRPAGAFINETALELLWTAALSRQLPLQLLQVL